MTVTYDISTLIGKVRLKTGDNKIASPVFTDEEIQVFLDETTDSVNLSSAILLEAWATKYVANVDSENIGGYSYSQSIVNKMLSLAQRLREAETTGDAVPLMSWSEMDLTGTVEATE